MPSRPRFDTLPRDVIRHIAFLSAADSPFDSPAAILNLLQTCTSLYRELSLVTAPDIYAHIFSVKFDTAASSRRYLAQLTDSAVAGELVNRYQLLRRVQRMDFSSAGLLQDLWTALWMLLENEGLNEQQLSAVGFTEFILRLALSLRTPSTAREPRTYGQYLGSICVWLLCLSLPKRMIVDMPNQRRDDLYCAIYPFVFASSDISPPLSPESSPLSPQVGPSSNHDRQGDGPCRTHGVDAVPHHGTCAADPQLVVYAYMKPSLPVLPDPSTAAINLVYAIYEARPMQVPPHLLPDFRAASNMAALSAQELEGYRISSVTAYRTLLFADYARGESPAVPPPRISDVPWAARALYDIDLQFRDTLQISGGPAHADAFRYIPGTLSALWEGTYRAIHAPTATSSKMPADTFMKPMYVQMTEYVCTTDNGIPLVTESGASGHDFPIDSFTTSETRLLIDGRVYHKYEPASAFIQNDVNAQITSLYDVILLGEAPEDYSHAWGGYQYSGRVRKDGSISLKRQTKDTGGQQSNGIWIFTGYLQSPAMILGRWQISGTPTGGAHDHGVFSLGRARL